MSKRLGMDGVLYTRPTLLTDTTWATASWVVVDHVRDLTLGVEKGEADVSDRANSGWESILGALKRGNIEFSIPWDDDDADLTLFRDAFMNDTEIACAILSDTIANDGQGLVSNFSVLKFERTENLEEGMMANVSMKPSSFTFWEGAAAS